MATLTAPPIAASGQRLRLDRVRAGVERWLESERAQLPLWTPVALGLGIALYFLLPWSGYRAAAAIVAVALIAGGILGGRATRLMAWAGVLVALGLGLAAWRTANVATPVLRDRYQGEISGRVVQVEVRSGRGQVRILVAPDNPGLPRQVRVSFKSDPPAGLVPGARVRLRAMLSPPAGPSFPGGYDFARRAWFAGIGATGYPLGPIVVTMAAPTPTGAMAHLAATRVMLTTRIASAVGGDPGAIAAAFVTGDQGLISLPVTEAMRHAGLAHLLSISGLHIAIVVGGAMWLARRGLSLSPWLALHWPVKALGALAAALAGIGYTLLAGGEVPTVRSCIATVIVLLGIVIGRDALSLRLIAAAAFGILVVRPEALLGPSFQLSFAAVTGLVALYQSRAGRWLSLPREDEGWRGRTTRHAIALVGTGLVAEAMLSATALFHFNQTGTYGVVANLVAIPLTSFVIMPLILIALAFDAVGLGAPCWWLVGQAMSVLIWVATTVAAWPGSVVRLASMPTGAYSLIVVGGLWLCLWATGARWIGMLAITAGTMLALIAQPADLLVSADGRHVALQIGDGRLALLRDRAGDYLRDMWGGATATTADAAIADLPTARCTVDACVARLGTGPASLRLLATISKERIARSSFAPACAASDIVISDRRMPDWCTSRWLKLDQAKLGTSGAVAVWLSPRRIETVAATVGDHPWLPQPQVWRADPRQAYRRSSPASLPWTRTRDGR